MTHLVERKAGHTDMASSHQSALIDAVGLIDRILIRHQSALMDAVGLIDRILVRHQSALMDVVGLIDRILIRHQSALMDAVGLIDRIVFRLWNRATEGPTGGLYLSIATLQCCSNALWHYISVVALHLCSVALLHYTAVVLHCCSASRQYRSTAKRRCYCKHTTKFCCQEAMLLQTHH